MKLFLTEIMLKYIVNILALFVVATTTANNSTIEIDYCNPKMCPYQGTHVACKNDGSFSKDCVGKYWLEPLDDKRKELILHEHNMYRNYVAAGKLKCFHPASRMPVLVWDDSLAKMAEYNVKTCKFAHDKCRSTPTFPYVGQNIYYASTARMHVSVEGFIEEGIYLWFVEYLDANHELMMNYGRTVPQTGHFTLMINDRQNKVGCAFLNNIQLSKKKLRRKVILTCNYPSNNIRYMPSYKPGPPTKDCKHINHKYKALCDDKIDPNDIYWYEN